MSIMDRIAKGVIDPWVPDVPAQRVPEPESPWLDMGFRDGLEWFRDNEHAPDVEYQDWIRWQYLPGLLRGMGADPDGRADQLTDKEREAVDSATAGLQKAHDLHRRRQDHERRSDGDTHTTA